MSTNPRDIHEGRRAQDFFRKSIELCMDGNLKELKKSTEEYLESNINVINSRDILTSFKSEGKSLLHIAASSGHANILDYYLKLVPNITDLLNTADDKGFTPLINATISESDVMIASLIKKGVDVNKCNKDGACATHFAAGDGSVNRLTILKAAGADLTIASKAGTPLHWAAGKGRSDAIKYLVNNGCDVNSSEGTVPAVIMAAGASCEEGTQFLVESGADVGHLLLGNITLLHICSEHGLLSAVKSILNTKGGAKCASIETTDGNSPLFLAAMANHKDVAILLIPYSINTTGGRYTIADIDEIMLEGKRRMEIWNDKEEAEKLKKEQEEADAKASIDKPSTCSVRIENELASLQIASGPEALSESEKWKTKANQFYMEKNFSAAISAYNEAIKLNGQSATLWSNRSACYLTMGDATNACHDAEICRRLDTKWVKGCYRLAMARIALGLFEDAAVAAFEGCKLDESNTELKKTLQLAVKLGQDEHRKKLAEKSSL